MSYSNDPFIDLKEEGGKKFGDIKRFCLKPGWRGLVQSRTIKSAPKDSLT